VTEISTIALWSTIAGLGVVSYGLRFSFLGLFGDRKPPDWADRLLRFVPVAILPALAAPMAVMPKGAEAGDPLRIGCALVTVAVGVATRNLLAAMMAGLGAFFAVQALGF